MIRYRLDDLGWYQFEWLVQSLLKYHIGLGIESWGGRGDWGRDAFYKGKLEYPQRRVKTQGPFIFQVKFIEGANAAGAKPNEALVHAVRAEASRVERRASHKTLYSPRHYLILTNAIVSGEMRSQIETILKSIVPSANIHIHGGNDLCDWLDQAPELRRAFPQLLSLRDLEDLLRSVVSQETIQRSRAAIDCAKDIVPVFVPTTSYERTWQVLRKHYFAVLEGPPEMGKTANAWMIALTQLSLGWQAVSCDRPEDIFKLYSQDTKQIFIADDAFGRTEYDPARGSLWEKQLDKVFRAINHRHWLIWTSRKHILERAIHEMDLQGQASKFPKPGDILVDAARLTEEEKALILYRHAKAANLEETAKKLVRAIAAGVVSDPHFTPERIRRFVAERLSELSALDVKGLLSRQQILAEVLNAIKNPTDQMRKSFRKLDPAQKWLLISLLEVESRYSSSWERASLPWGRKEHLRAAYDAHCPKECWRPFEDVFDEMSEAFIKMY